MSCYVEREEAMLRKKHALLAGFVAGGCLLLAAFAWAAENVSVQASFKPNKLGAPTNLSATVTFRSATPGPQSPVTKVTAYAPAGLLVDVRGAGICNATPAKLEEAGPSACPPDSRVGFGRGVGLFEIAHELVPGPFTLEFFLAPRERGRLVMLVYVNAVTPAVEQLVLVAREVRAPKPYGLGISFDVPIVPTLPGANLGWVDHVLLSLGATNVAYYRKVHGKRTLLHVRGVIVPRTCPPGGFPIEATIGFADGTTTTVNPTIPCPRK
jgi:hypothetical protein